MLDILLTFYTQDEVDFIHAVENSDIDKIKECIASRGTSTLSGGYEFPFAIAASIGNREVIDIFLDAGSSGRAPDDSGKRFFALRAALEKGHTDIAYYIAMKNEIPMDSVTKSFFDVMIFSKDLRGQVELMPFSAFCELAATFKDDKSQTGELTKLYVDRRLGLLSQSFFSNPKSLTENTFRVTEIEGAEEPSVEVRLASGDLLIPSAKIHINDDEVIVFHGPGKSMLEFDKETEKLTRTSQAPLKKSTSV